MSSKINLSERRGAGGVSKISTPTENIRSVVLRVFFYPDENVVVNQNVFPFVTNVVSVENSYSIDFFLFRPQLWFVFTKNKSVFSLSPRDRIDYFLEFSRHFFFILRNNDACFVVMFIACRSDGENVDRYDVRLGRARLLDGTTKADGRAEGRAKLVDFRRNDTDAGTRRNGGGYGCLRP